MNEETKKLVQELYEMLMRAESCIALLQTAFIYNSAKHLTECYETVNAIKAREPELTKKIVDLSQKDADLTQYIPAPGHIIRIAENIEKIAASIEKKIRNCILFSDRAVTETTFLLQRLSEVLKPAADIILAQNVYLNRYIQESEAGITRRATEYATLHEERLVAGECLPVASSIYVNMLDAIKGIAWHAKEIAAKLVGWALPKA